MNVISETYVPEGLVISVRRSRLGSYIRREPSKTGYFNVVWVGKDCDIKEVAHCIRKVRAEKLVALLNGLSRRDAYFLVKVLLNQGELIHAGKMSESRSRYTGRSFDNNYR